ncbi:MAG: hypothetical protein ABFD08_04255 [Syntrophomonas sp.]
MSEKDLLRSIALQTNQPAHDYKTAELSFWYLSAINAWKGNTEESLTYLIQLVLKKPACRCIQKLCLLLLNRGIDKELLIKSLVKGGIPHLAANIMVSQVDSEITWEMLANPEGREKLDWVRFEMYQGNYQAVNDWVEKNRDIVGIDDRLLSCCCVSRWLETPRRSAAELLIAANPDRAVIQACILAENLIFKGSWNSIDQNDKTARELVNLSLMLYQMGDLCLALEIGKRLLDVTMEKYCAILGKKALVNGYYREARILLEQSLSGEEQKAEIYAELGVVCVHLEQYEQAFEYFRHAMTIDSGNRIYPCLTYEALAMKGRQILVLRFASLERSPELKKELLYLCSVRNKSMHLRKQIVKQNDEHFQEDGAGILSLLDDFGTEELWNGYV